jgi:ATP-binding cassette subfamily B (MDR/TAP) protein 1
VLVNKFGATLDINMKQGVKAANVAGAGFGASNFIMFAAYGLAFWYGSHLIRDGEMTMANVMKVFFAIVMSAMGVGQTSSLAPDYQKAAVSADEIYTLLETKSDIDSESPNGKKMDISSGEITFDNVVFEYPTRPGARIFNGFNLTVKPRQSLALVGGSGSGKSSVISLIQRFYDPLPGQLHGLTSSSSVLVDGVDIKSLNVQHYRSQIGVVSQEPTLFTGTIRENILYGNPSATEEQIIDAAKRANIHNFITNLKDGYDTRCGNKGLMLSGGQKQRIAIARAIIRNPKILLLDEATSALDSTSEKLVQKALDELMKGRTTVLIAHRLSTVRNADLIAVLENGKIVEGPAPHDQLMALNGQYALLVRTNQERME